MREKKQLDLNNPNQRGLLGILPLGLLVAERRSSRDGVDDVAASVRRSWAWIAVCAVVFGIFLFVQSRGLGSLAGTSFVR